MISVYADIPVTKSNSNQYEEIGETIQKRALSDSKLLIAGDMNAHIQQLDGHIDGRGKILVELANQHNL